MRKELHSETLIQKLHFKGSWQIHGQPHGVKRSGADLVTTMTSLNKNFCIILYLMSFIFNVQLAPSSHKQSERELLFCICSNDFSLTTLMQM